MRNPGKLVRAYSVQGNDGGCVVFATSNVLARREGADRLECTFPEIESCRLAPEFDVYAEAGHVPRQTLVEKHGWWQYCSYCENQVSANTAAFGMRTPSIVTFSARRITSTGIATGELSAIAEALRRMKPPLSP